MSEQSITHTRYKESGVDWIGAVPEHWQLLPARVAVTNLAEKNEGARNQDYLSLVAGRGVIPYEDKGDMGNKKPDDLSKCKIVRKGNIVINSMNFFIGSYGMSEYDGVCSPVYIVLDVKQSAMVQRFALMLFGTTGFQLYLATFGEGILKHRAAIGWDDIKGTYLPIPPLEEQTQIAKFLDYETAKIDALIEKQQQLIALLKEKRQAVISHAVTKGLNPDAPMRDSGVEWLGEVPAHWDSLRVGVLFSESSARAMTPKELSLPILSVSIHHGISDRELDEEELDRKISRSEDRSLYKTVHENDLAYNMMRAWQGGFGAATIPGLISPAYVVCKPKRDLSARYFELVLRTASAIVELKRFSRGITDFRLRLYWDDFKNIHVPVPPRHEMDEIVQHSEIVSRKYDDLTHAAIAQISLLQERRTALISAAVTGKIDVRGWRAPDAAPKEEIA